jgi:hypothetical protein
MTNIAQFQIEKDNAQNNWPACFKNVKVKEDKERKKKYPD